MIYILAYIVLGVFTFIWGWFVIGSGDRGYPAAVMGLVWPVVWVVAISNAIRGRIVAKCAWCGKSVGTQYELDKWRAHYVEDCDKHPLAAKCKRLENYCDELDAKCTHYRVKSDILEADVECNRDACEMTQRDLRMMESTIASKDKIITHYKNLAARNWQIAQANELALDAANKQLAVTGALLEVETARANRIHPTSKWDVLHG